MNTSSPRGPIKGGELAELCWSQLVAAFPDDVAVDSIISAAAHYARVGDDDVINGPATMRKLAESLWKQGFEACLVAQEFGAFTRIRDN